MSGGADIAAGRFEHHGGRLCVARYQVGFKAQSGVEF